MSVSASAYASLYNSSSLNSYAAGPETLYQRTATNRLDAKQPTYLGTLTTDSTQLDAVSTLSRNSPVHSYKFDLKGDSLKLELSNVTDTSELRLQLYNSSGTLVADSEGTDEQKLAYDYVTTEAGLAAEAGSYTAKVSFSSTALRNVAQNYSLSLYSGSSFSASYLTNAVTQTADTQIVPVDNTGTFATYDAQSYSNEVVNSANATALSAPNIGWLYKNKSSLSVQGQLSSVVTAHYYQFTFQKGDEIRLAFNQTSQTTKTGLRVQIIDALGQYVYADSGGSSQQRQAFDKLTSADGLKLRNGQYVVKVTYDRNGDKDTKPNYNFQLFSGATYDAQYQTKAYTQTAADAVRSGAIGGKGNSSLVSAAAYLYAQSQGQTQDISSALKAFV